MGKAISIRHILGMETRRHLARQRLESRVGITCFPFVDDGTIGCLTWPGKPDMQLIPPITVCCKRGLTVQSRVSVWTLYVLLCHSVLTLQPFHAGDSSSGADTSSHTPQLAHKTERYGIPGRRCYLRFCFSHESLF